MTNTRRYALARTVAPVAEPVTLAQAKLYLRVDTSTEDSLINDIIVAARMAAEQFMRRALITQTWKLSFDEYLDDEVLFPLTPVSSVSSVTLYDRTDVPQIIDADIYHLNAAKDVLKLDTVLFAHRAEIVFVAGYGDADDVPAPIKHGILGHIAHMYDMRGIDNAGLPETTQRLYLPFREVRL